LGGEAEDEADNAAGTRVEAESAAEPAEAPAVGDESDIAPLPDDSEMP
jgi:hypothetical protein